MLKPRCLLVCLLAVLVAAAAQALSPNEVLFYAPLDGSAVPAVVQGTDAPAIEGELRFAPGKRGQALVAGGAEAPRVRYPAAGNWLPEQGTLALWVCPQDWHYGDGKHHVFVALESTPAALLYSYIALPTFFLQLTPDNSNPRVGTDLQWKEGEWHHLTVTWQEGEYCLYVDGKLVSRDTETMGAFTETGKYFGLGTHVWGTQDHTLLDDLVILRRALTTAEVAALFDFAGQAASAGPVPTVTDVPAFTASLRSFPTAEKLEVTVRATGVGLEPGKTLAVGAEVLSPEGKVLARRTVAAPAGKPTRTEVAQRGWPAGNYRVRLTAAGANGQPETRELTWERRARPVWAGNRLGLDGSVPAPWTPVQVAGGPGQSPIVKTWGREYLLGQGLCEQVTTQGVPLLAGPLQLRLTQPAGTASAKALTTTATRAVSKSAEKATFVTQRPLGNCILKTRTTCEFDGFTWYEIEIIPPAGAAAVDALALEMPFAKEHATLFYSGIYYPSLDNGTGAIKPEGFKGDWRNWFWVGEERGGIEWFAEDNRGWQISKPKEALTITPGAQQTLVRLNIIDAPTKLSKPLKLAFGFQATPVKAPRPDRRSWRAIAQQPGTGVEQAYMLPEDRRVKGVTLWNEGWTETWMIPKPRDWAKASIAKAESQGLRTCMYLAQNTVDPREEWFRYYWEDWRRTPGTAYNPDWLASKDYYLECGICPASEYRDYYIWLVDKAIRETGVKALYFDNSVPGVCDNPYHGCGVKQADGTVAGRVPLLAARDWYKRVYRLMRKHDPTSIIAIHMSGYPLVPLQSFCDYICDGENFTGYMQVIKNEKGWDNYWHTIPLDVMRAQYRNHWGPETAFLPEFARALGEQWNANEPHVIESVEHLIGLFFVHDSGLWPCWSTVEPYGRFFRAQDRFGWDDKVSFTPYWDLQGKAKIEAGQQPVVMSLFQRPGKVMFVPFNNTDEAQTVTVSWEAGKLGLGEVTELEDLLRGEKFAVTGNEAKVPVGRHNFRMLVPVGR